VAHQLIWWRGFPLKLLIKPAPRENAVAELKNPAVGLAGVGEGLALAEGDLEQPLASSRAGNPSVRRLQL